MKLTHYQSAEEFLTTTRETMEAHEVVNSLMLGIAENLTQNPHFYSDADPYLAVVEHDGRQVLRATMTPPYGLLLTYPSPPEAEAFQLVVEDIQEKGLPLANLSCTKPIAEQFAQAWANHHQGSYQLEMAQRLYELRTVNPVENVPGEIRTAVGADVPLLVEWMIAFEIDCFGKLESEEERITKNVAAGVAAGSWGIWFNEENPVSMVVSGRPTRHGISVSGVYTPPEHRKHGYASACVAAHSQKLLDQGYQFCSLFTDLANPTSNSIYMQIGYQPVADFDKFKLIPPQS
ncbi:MAG: GNAT family N-acetyltransferase [Chloroflexota bacterium]